MKVEVLSRFRTPAQQKEILRRTASGEVDVLIGTHRILQKDVAFKISVCSSWTKSSGSV